MMTRVAEVKFAAVMSAVERRRSYSLAVPVVPSSPGAVQDTAMVVLPTLGTNKSVTSAGGMMSFSGSGHSAMMFRPEHFVGALMTLLIPDQFPASSFDLSAK